MLVSTNTIVLKVQFVTTREVIILIHDVKSHIKITTSQATKLAK